MSAVSKQEQSDAVDFNWSLWQFCQHLTEIRDWKLAEAIPEIDRAIGRGEVPYLFFDRLDGKLIAGQGKSDPLFWQSSVQLHVSKDAEGNVIDVLTLGAGGAVGWDPNRYPCRVPERIVRERYAQNASATKHSYSVPQRRRGPPTTHDWHTIDGEIARRCIDPKTQRLAVPKSENKLATAMLQWCTDTFEREPSSSEMREAVRRVCRALRQV